MEGKRVNQEAIREERKEREIKRVREGDLLNAALTEGREITDQAQAALLNTLQRAINEHGIPGAVSYCHTGARPLMDSVSQDNEAQVRRVSHRVRNPDNKPDDVEKQLLNAYSYSVEQGLDPGDNIQLLDNGKILYTRPILLKNTLCLNCHGPYDNITPETMAVINELYPEDEATGFEVDDFRGMWSVTLYKKEIIKNM